MSLFQSALLDDKKVPNTNESPVSASEKLVREDIKKLNENAEEIKKLKEQVDKKKEAEKEQGKPQV